MSKRQSNGSSSQVELPDIILVSQNRTNGLFHHVRNYDELIEVLMEHISIRCFTDQTIPEGGSIDELDPYVGDFAMWKIACKPNLQFQKQEGLLCQEDLLKFVCETRKKMELVNLGGYSGLHIQKLSEQLTIVRDAFKEALKVYVDELLSSIFTV